MIRLPDRHDAAVLAGVGLVVWGIYQAMPWLAIAIAGAFLVYIGVFTEHE